MQRKKFYSLSMFVMASLIVGGCSTKKVNQPMVKVEEVKPKIVQSIAQTLTIRDIKNAKIERALLKGNQKYKEQQPVQFVVDTKGKEGYLYIIYLDNKKNTQLLYPNLKSPLTEVKGEYLFPRDFGNMKIIASKDCSTSKEERTEIYAVLSKNPIVDIEKISAKELLPPPKSKSITLKLEEDEPKSSNIYIGKLEFLVN